MKKFLALLLSVAMLLIPMTAFAAIIPSMVIPANVDWLKDKITITGEFLADDGAQDKIATLVVLHEGKTKADITGSNLTGNNLNPVSNANIILWADQYLIGEDSKFTFEIDALEIPSDTGTGYNFYISVPGVTARTYEGNFSYNVATMETKLIEQFNGNITAAGMDEYISEIAKNRINRAADAIAVANPAFNKNVVADYMNLPATAKNNVQNVLITSAYRPYADLQDFVIKLRAAINAQPTVIIPSTGGPGGGGGGGATVGGGGSAGAAIGGGLIAPAGNSNPFFDISNNYWGKDAILNLYSKGIVKGQGNGYFRPDNTITRAEFVQMVVMAFDFILQGKTADFTDVADTDWFANAVKIAYGNGVVNGTSDTTFSPTSNITRQDMMTILYNAAKSKGINLTSGTASFTDAGSISGYAQEAVAAMVGSNVVSGYTDGSVKPLNNASRAEAAAMLSRLLEVR